MLWGEENPKLANIAMQQAKVALLRDNPQDGIAFASEAQNIFSIAKQVAPYIDATCLLAQAQAAQDLKNPIAEKTAEECVLMSNKQISPASQNHLVAMANLAMDRNDIEQADHRLKMASTSSKTTSAALVLAWLRLQEVQKSFALDDAVFDKVQNTLMQQIPLQRDLIRAVKALHANFFCRRAELSKGQDLRLQVVSELNLKSPERRFEIRQLQDLSKACN